MTVQDVGGSTLVIDASVTVNDLAISLTGQLNPSSDSGESNMDAITNVEPAEFLRRRHRHPAERPGCRGAIRGHHSVRAHSRRRLNGAIGQTQAGSDGSWSITSNFLADGKYVITAHAVDQAGFTTATTQILPNATQGVLTIDTVGPKVTALSFDRVDGQIDLTFQDSLSGMDQAEVIDAANYQLTKLHTLRGRYLVNVISATPSGRPVPRTWS